jgi:hypothetical protein
LIEFIGDPTSFPSLCIAFSLNIWILSSYFVESIAASLTKSAFERFKLEKERLMKKRRDSKSKQEPSPRNTKDESENASKNSVSDSEQPSPKAQKSKKTFSDLWKQMIRHIQFFAFVSHFIIITSLLVVPVVLIIIINPNPVASMINCMLLTVVFLKLVSYAVVNAKLRENMYDRKKRNEDLQSQETIPVYAVAGPLKHPENVTIYNIYYFMFAPTLVYEENFPRNKNIRWDFLIKRCMELVIISAVIVVLVEQYIVPLVKNSMRPMKENDTLKVFERLLKLTIPNIVVWVLGFYAFFHLFLNIIAEILCYGDRLFYQEWWNATTMGYFWRTWNIPVNMVSIFLFISYCIEMIDNNNMFQ